jgi:hypothetical protein
MEASILNIWQFLEYADTDLNIVRKKHLYNLQITNFKVSLNI